MLSGILVLQTCYRENNFLLCTVKQTTVSKAYSWFDLEVSHLGSDNFHDPLEVITQREMPVTAEDMVIPEDLAKWTYLSKIHLPSLKAKAPKSLEPWEVINSCGNSP